MIRRFLVSFSVKNVLIFISTIKKCFFNIRNIGKIKNYLDEYSCKMLVNNWSVRRNNFLMALLRKECYSSLATITLFIKLWRNQCSFFIHNATCCYNYTKVILIIFDSFKKPTLWTTGLRCFNCSFDLLGGSTYIGPSQILIFHSFILWIKYGSVLATLLFSLYLKPLADIITNFGFSYHFYAADHVQFYVSVDKDNNYDKNVISEC